MLLTRLHASLVLHCKYLHYNPTNKNNQIDISEDLKPVEHFGQSQSIRNQQ